MLSIYDEIVEAQQGKSAGQSDYCCTVGFILASLDPEEAQGLSDALAQPKEIIAGSVIAGILKKRGYKVSESTVRRHRRTCTNRENTDS